MFIGGYDDLRRFFGLKVKDPAATSYTSVLAVFGVAAAIALVIDYLTRGPLLSLLARRVVPYGYVYPFVEFGAGVLMLAGVLSAPVVLVIGTIGAVSVFKAVHIDKRELKCACVGSCP